MPRGPALMFARPAAFARAAFSLVELLVVVAIVAVLASVLLPALRMGRIEASAIRCGANLQQMGVGFHFYANDNLGAAMPTAWFDDATIQRLGGPVYWWGLSLPNRVDVHRGLLWTYLLSPLEEDGLFECPSQPIGTYTPQGDARVLTSTYGYNGYYLSPAGTPGWSPDIRHRPWQRLDLVGDPARLLTFGDALAVINGVCSNSSLLDPPLVYFASTRTWRRNRYPNNAFRHHGRTMAALADGHVERMQTSRELLTDVRLRIGALSRENDPWYVPDWRSW